VARERPIPLVGDGQVLIEVSACGVCRTDRHLHESRLSGAADWQPIDEWQTRTLENPDKASILNH
jgi:D-arabinose 1-dehydrogenase-like Zn-dependent alcohol dehydrogenase